jgi:hypothetical protein
VQSKFNLSTDNFQRDDREMTTCVMMDQVTSFRRQAVRAAAAREELIRQDLKALMGLVRSPAAGPPALDTVRVSHCGRWRIIERAIGRALLPEVVEAQPRAPGRQDSSRATPVQVAPGDPGVRPGPIPAVMASLAEAISVRDDAVRARHQANRFAVEIHKKYTISVACFTFVLIGVALALRFPRGGMGLVIGGGLAIFAIFYISMVGGEALGDRGLVSPALAMWFPNGLMLVAGIAGLIRVNREFGSTRGGDLADLFDSVRGWFRLRRRVG